MRVIVTLTAAFCLGATAFAAAAKPAANGGTAALPVIDVPFQQFELANGLRVIVHEDHKAPLVALNIWYHIGSKDEPAGRHGFAHLFEHLMFNGSEHYDDEFFRALEPAGGTNLNGTTNSDRTEYHETVPTAAFDLALWLESDRMGYLTGAIDQAKLDEQRGVVLNEKREGDNRPYGDLREIIARESFPPEHPYSWTTIGSKKDLDAATLDDVKAWFKHYYGPNNAVLVIAGDVDTATVKARVEKYFGEIPPGPPVSHAEQWVAKMQGNKRLRVEDDVPLPRLYMIWNAPGDGKRDAVLLDILSDLMTGNRNGRLSQRLVYRDQSAAGVSASLDSDEIASQFTIVASAKPGGDLDTIETAIDEELARLLAKGPTAEELKRVKTRRYAELLPAFDSVGAKAGLLAANATYHDNPASYKQEIAWEREATPADIRDAARRWLADGRLTIDVQPQSGLKPSAQKVDRSALPVPAASADLKLPPVQHATLPNGLKLALIERHGVPLVELGLIVDAGRAADGGVNGQSGLAALTFEQLDQGAGTLDSQAIARRESELGISIGTSTQREASLVTLTAIKPKLSEALDLYTKIIREPSFPAADLTRSKQRLLAAIASEKASAGGRLRRVLSKLVYGPDHAYAFVGLGDEQVVAGVTRGDLEGFYRRWVRPDNATLLIVGDTTMAEIKPLLEARFGHWQAPATPLPEKNIAAVAPATQSRVFLIDKPGAPQSVIAAANIAPPGSATDNEAMETVNTILGGQFISRLNLNLREDKHWSYGAGSSLTRARGPQVFIAQAAVQSDHTADSMLEMRKELVGITGARPLTATEIDSAKRSDILALPGSFETIDQVASAYAGLIEVGEPDDYFNRLPAKIRSETPEQLAAAAKQLVKPDALTWVVVGDLAKIEANVRKLDLGPVQVLDADGKVLR